MRNVVFDPRARLEFEEAADYYEERRFYLGEEFTDEVLEALSRISKNPGLYAAVQGAAYRVCHLNRFPYAIIYRLDADAIFVAAIAHQKRRPAYWSQRLKDPPGL